jgi:hypothetical protein
MLAFIDWTFRSMLRGLPLAAGSRAFVPWKADDKKLA